MSTAHSRVAPRVSIVIPCKNEGANMKMTVDSILESLPEKLAEIIVVDDDSADDCCKFLHSGRSYRQIKLISTTGVGAARARNLGAAAASGEFLIFCDAHITVPEGWVETLINNFSLLEAGAVAPAIGSLAEPAKTGYGLTWNSQLEAIWLPPPRDFKPSPVPFLPGGCLAVRADAFNEVGGFDNGFQVWGYEDTELSLKLWLFGFSQYIVPVVKILHIFRQIHPYHVNMNHVHYNMLRMAYSHFKEERIERVLDLFNKSNWQKKRLTNRVIGDGAMEQRQSYFARRVHDDDWFMNKFIICF